MRHRNIANRDESCLVVIDMQEPFLRAIHDRATVISNVNRLINAAVIMRLPIIVTLQNADRMGNTVPEVFENLPPHEPIDKMTFSCCGDETFMHELEKIGKGTVILCGIETHICVNQTALDLVQSGYEVHVPDDAVSSRTERNWQSGLAKMRQSNVIVTSTEMLIYELLVRAGTDEFRKILKYIK